MNENKKIVICGIIFTLIIVVVGTFFSVTYNKEKYAKQKVDTNVGIANAGEKVENKGIKKAVKVEGKVYYDTGRKSTALRCGMMDGKIISNVEASKIPTVDNQSNFEGEYGFQYGDKNTIEIFINNEWCIFETEEVDEYYFYGKVIESSQKHILVEPNEGEEIRKSASKIFVGLGEDNDAIYEVGTNVKITYSGDVMESYPAQVKATKIEIKSTENFEIRFYDKHPEASEKIHKILDKSETDKCSYNVYCYDGSVNILINGEELSLRNALLENKITMDEIISKANADLRDKKITGDTYKDGGSIEYHYGSYTIIKCHTLNENRDVYIGTSDLNINDLKL